MVYRVEKVPKETNERKAYDGESGAYTTVNQHCIHITHFKALILLNAARVVVRKWKLH